MPTMVKGVLLNALLTVLLLILTTVILSAATGGAVGPPEFALLLALAVGFFVWRIARLRKTTAAPPGN
jgi:hypothetical protein